MNRLLVVASFLFSACFAQASDFGIEGGFRSQSGSYNVSGYSTGSKTGIQVGGVGHFELSGPWYLRSGLFYTQRPIELMLNSPLSGSADLMFTYFDLPAQIMYKFEDYGGVFIGPMVSMLLEKKASGSGGLSGLTITEANSMVIPIQLGATFKFAPQMGATLYYEMMAGGVAKDLDTFRAVGVNFLFTFD